MAWFIKLPKRSTKIANGELFFVAKFLQVRLPMSVDFGFQFFVQGKEKGTQLIDLELAGEKRGRSSISDHYWKYLCKVLPAPNSRGTAFH